MRNTIFIVDGHPIVRSALGMIVKKATQGATVIELSNCPFIDNHVEKGTNPILFVIEILAQGAKGLAQISSLKSKYPKTPIIIFSALPHCDAASQCIAAGAFAYLEKTADEVEIIATIRASLDIQDPYSDRLNTSLKLSKRQKELILLLDAGLSNAEIAEKIERSEHTVKVHLWRMFKKFDVNSRTQAIHLARRAGLI